MQIVIQNILTNYEVLGVENEKTIVTLHGWGQSLGDWKNISKALSSKYKVITLDLPGFGSSSLPNEVFNTQKYSEFIEEFIKKLSIKGIFLIGHSFGGKLAIKLASENPEVKRLFLISPSGIESKSLFVIIKTMFSKVFKTMFFFLPSSLKERLILILGSQDYVNAGKMRETLKRVIDEKVISSALKIDIPTLIIWGENDTELNIKNAKLLKRLIKNSTLRILWGVGHSPNIEAPDKLYSLLSEYL